ncbi:Dihydropteroate synthase [Piromyces finnis]|uniref:Folic acid synthesis protein FOL1 n=1 Tax=Piromyces finnis TaxID=1754191 RepID=A0A1Y1V0L5_9FUNG|nr:Dihydropteroate synthase [Piromyces finnis]|eukprot:ORX43819.1 Dihydropteroate synthase [Piromyces finnis]
MSDIIKIKQLNVKSTIGTETWGKPKLQPVIVDVVVYTDVMKCGETDNLEDTIDYSEIVKAVIKFSEEGSFNSIHEYSIKLVQAITSEFTVEKINVKVALPRAHLHSNALVCSITRTKDNVNELFTKDDTYTIDKLNVNTVIGFNDCEKVVKQALDITISYYPKVDSEIKAIEDLSNIINCKILADEVNDLVERTRFITIEALASSIANCCLTSFGVEKVNVRVEKPNAITFASASAVEIERDISSIPKLNKKYQSHFQSEKRAPTHVAYIALGGNIGEVAKNISKAVKLLGEKCKVLQTSYLYETSPMYVVDQPNFLNAACKVLTDLDPFELLAFLKKIEKDIGRVPSIRNGPRAVDLDILFYDKLILKTENLIIPHPRISERRFVLEPLNDIAKNLIHPTKQQTINSLLKVLKHNPSEAYNKVRRVMPIRKQLWRWNEKTYLMGILNATPDSFSDGGKYNTLETGLAHAKEMVENQVDIIDIGGMSTRPFSDDGVTEEEELRRVIPLIKAIRAEPWGKDIPISVDTFRAEVALQSVEAGADLINDVTGGEGDPRMFEVMAQTDVPVCLMHMRGTPKTMQLECEYEKGVLHEIEHVIADRVEKAELLGVRLWNVILDPGIGFSKNVEQNFEIVRGMETLVNENSRLANMPTLVGPSRKSFIGKTLNKPVPSERVWGTAAVCTALIAVNTSIIRVHDFKEMKDIITISDKIYRKN